MRCNGSDAMGNGEAEIRCTALAATPLQRKRKTERRGREAETRSGTERSGRGQTTKQRCDVCDAHYAMRSKSDESMRRIDAANARPQSLCDWNSAFVGFGVSDPNGAAAAAAAAQRWGRHGLATRQRVGRGARAVALKLGRAYAFGAPPAAAAAAPAGGAVFCPLPPAAAAAGSCGGC